MDDSEWMLAVLQVVFLSFRGIFGPQDAGKKHPRHWAIEFWKDGVPFFSSNEEYQCGDSLSLGKPVVYVLSQLNKLYGNHGMTGKIQLHFWKIPKDLPPI